MYHGVFLLYSSPGVILLHAVCRWVVGVGKFSGVLTFVLSLPWFWSVLLEFVLIQKHFCNAEWNIGFSAILLQFVYNINVVCC